ncbi:MAG TPA: hypothetical protein PK082_00830 [Phycisphaerae bacterium]|nr:hypothetical protein [Phycisphaerae bacterium]
MNEPNPRAMTRRELLRAAGRGLAGAALAVVAWTLARRGRTDEGSCVNAGACARCPILSDCAQAPAAAARAQRKDAGR